MATRSDGSGDESESEHVVGSQDEPSNAVAANSSPMQSSSSSEEARERWRWYQKYREKYDHPAASPYWPWFRFKPTDKELILHFLKLKVTKGCLSHRMIDFSVYNFNHPAVRSGRLPPPIIDVDFYDLNPQSIPENYKLCGADAWYFFTKWDPAKSRAAPRSVPGGVWVPLAPDKVIKHGGKRIGYRKSLIFFQGSLQEQLNETDWMAHEYRLAENVINTHRNDEENCAREDDWVLNRFYGKEPERQLQEVRSQDAGVSQHGPNPVRRSPRLRQKESHASPRRSLRLRNKESRVSLPVQGKSMSGGGRGHRKNLSRLRPSVGKPPRAREPGDTRRTQSKPKKGGGGTA